MERTAFRDVVAEAQYLAAVPGVLLPLLNGGTLPERPNDQQSQDEQQYCQGEQAKSALHIVNQNVSTCSIYRNPNMDICSRSGDVARYQKFMIHT
jgi:hypothetical protein